MSKRKPRPEMGPSEEMALVRRAIKLNRLWITMALVTDFSLSTGGSSAIVFSSIIGIFAISVLGFLVWKDNFTDTLVFDAVVITLTIIIAFSHLFYAISRSDAADCAVRSTCNFSESLTKIDAMYFTMSTVTTTGYGDIAPVSQLARGVVAGLQGVVLIMLTVGAALLLTRISRKREARAYKA